MSSAPPQYIEDFDAGSQPSDHGPVSTLPPENTNAHPESGRDSGRNDGKRQRRGSAIDLQEGQINHEYQLHCLSNIYLDPVARQLFCASNVVTPKEEPDWETKTCKDDVTGEPQPWRPLHKFLWRRVVLDDRFVWLALFGPNTTRWIQDQHRKNFPDGVVVKEDTGEIEFAIDGSPKMGSDSPEPSRQTSDEGKQFGSFMPQVGSMGGQTPPLGVAKSPSAASFGTKFHLREFQNGNDVKSAPFLKKFHWRRVTYDSYFAMVPGLRQGEIQFLDKLLDFEQDIRQQRALLQHSCNSIAEIMKTREFSFNRHEKIEHVVLLVVVLAEVAPILANLKFTEDLEANETLGGLAYCYSGQFGSYKLTVVKVAESDIFSRHYSGYTQVAGIAALTAKLLKPSLVVSFGTAGGVPPTIVGGVVLASGCLFLDRTRTSSAGAFSWGIWGGGTVKTPNLATRLEEFSVKYAPCASQISYAVSQLSMEKIKAHDVACLDMEAAS